jgi:bifunctional DNA-binding transcriptional regulator/antitoxin component of YhaV-PrlF toxin-antitoxin module
MYTTVEAIYDNGRIIPIEKKLKIKKGRVLITFLNEEEIGIKKKSSLENLLKYKGKIKNLPKDPVAYQRELRDAW